jgi:hypothetical protein
MALMNEWLDHGLITCFISRTVEFAILGGLFTLRAENRVQGVVIQASPAQDGSHFCLAQIDQNK